MPGDDPLVEPLRAAAAAVADTCGTVAIVALRRDEVVLDHAMGRTTDGAPFTSTTPVFLYSAVKPMTALCVLLAAADGALDLADPVAAHWPAFGAHGKDEVTVAEALAHGAAVPGWRRPMSTTDLADRRGAAAELAASRPWWTPGEPGEHALSYGHLLDGILRHATGRGITSWWADAVAATGVPIDLVAGTGDRRPAPLEDPGHRWRDAWRVLGGRMAELLGGAAGLLDVDVVNGDEVGSLVAPAVTGYASAHDLAGFWAWWASPTASERLGGDHHLRPVLEDSDHELEHDVAWGLGPQFDPDRSYGMGGIGGSVGWYGPELDLAIGVTTPVVGSLERLDPLQDAIESLRRT